MVADAAARALEGEKPAAVLDGGRLFPGKVETFRREAPKVGRNDPVPLRQRQEVQKMLRQGRLRWPRFAPLRLLKESTLAELQSHGDEPGPLYRGVSQGVVSPALLGRLAVESL